MSGDLVTSAFSCAPIEVDKHRCVDLRQDLSYHYRRLLPIINVVYAVIGIVTFWGFIKPAALKFQSLPFEVLEDCWGTGSFLSRLYCFSIMGIAIGFSVYRGSGVHSATFDESDPMGINVHVKKLLAVDRGRRFHNVSDSPASDQV